ncbi:MAG: proteasome accessory factor PafA2 family protein [Methanobacteriota archaeon]
MIQGNEQEYTLYSNKMNPAGIDPHRLALELLRKSELAAQGEFLKNGSRAYFDVGHLEISTPECANFYDALIWEKAGERIVDMLRAKLEDGHNVKINAFKNNTDPDGVSYGSHENYCVQRKVKFPEEFIERLVPHLVTRMIYTGAGDVVDGVYVISPCAYLTSQLVSGGNLSNTGVLHTRDEPHADPERFRRLHIIVGDALMGEYPILLRGFSTGHILRLIERGEVKSPPKLANPIEDMWHNVEQVAPEKWSFELDGGKKVTPMDIQRYYLAKVEKHVSGEKEKMAFKAWEWTLDKLEAGDLKALSRRVEWVSRLYEVERQIEVKGKHESVEIAACKQYSELGINRGLHYKLQTADGVDRLLDDDEIKRAILAPPSDTRAIVRTKLLEDYEASSVDWSEIRVSTEDGGYEKIELPDPYESSYKY